MESSEEIINELIKEYKKEDNLINEQKIIKRQKENLPIFNFKKDLLKSLSEIKENVLIIIGETGSGKSTQISQYLIEANYHKSGIIGITQPRRVGAVSVARRVAEEFGCDIGDEVGYTVRFSNVTSSRTIIKYMTDGILLRECLVDSNLKNYSVIILDEAHERSVNTDILFGLMKMIIKKRLDLKLLITSATLEETKFSSFFHDCPIFIVPGRSFPVEIFYVEERPVDYVEASLDIILKIHENEPQGDILLFLTGQSEIDQACKRLQKKFQKLLIDRGSDKEIKDLLILPLYAALPPSEQVLVFQSTPMNTRKVVIATNIAETSLTVDGIVYVIDPGYVKQKGFNKIGSGGSKNSKLIISLIPITKSSKTTFAKLDL
jgi:ATP-dependent RNA helicase DHX8/PRP22